MRARFSGVRPPGRPCHRSSSRTCFTKRSCGFWGRRATVLPDRETLPRYGRREPDRRSSAVLLPTPLPPRMQKKLPAIRCEIQPPGLRPRPPAHIGTRPPGLSPRVPARPCGSRAWGGRGRRGCSAAHCSRNCRPLPAVRGTGQVAGHAAPDPHRRRHGGQHGMCLFPEGGKDSLGSPPR